MSEQLRSFVRDKAADVLYMMMLLLNLLASTLRPVYFASHIYFKCGNVTTLNDSCSVCVSVCLFFFPHSFLCLCEFLSGKHSRLPGEHSSFFETANTWYNMLELRCGYLASDQPALTVMSLAMAPVSAQITHTAIFRRNDIITVS